jgi:hypothetical protein
MKWREIIKDQIIQVFLANLETNILYARGEFIAMLLAILKNVSPKDLWHLLEDKCAPKPLHMPRIEFNYILRPFAFINLPQKMLNLTLEKSFQINECNLIWVNQKDKSFICYNCSLVGHIHHECPHNRGRLHNNLYTQTPKIIALKEKLGITKPG